MYLPAQDSYLLASTIKKFLSNFSKEEKEKMQVLDMGSGSGIQTHTCIKEGILSKNIISADIDKEVVSFLKQKNLQAIKSNLFSKIRKKFNLIVFNPPYLPEHPKERAVDTTGGKKGYETIICFLSQAKNHLKKEGKILLLLSSLSKPKIIKSNSKSYNLREVAKEKLFFEELYVWELSLK